jgi:ribosome-associated heat shock protein Hsp15
VNDAHVKPSREVKVGETIVLLKNSARFQYKVIGLLDKRVGASLVKDFIQDHTAPEEIEKLKAYQESQRNYRLTDGKPTKKDRRELDRFMEDWQED